MRGMTKYLSRHLKDKMSYYFSKKHDLAVAQIPKAGLMTLQDWLYGFDVVKNDDADLLNCSNRIMFVRNPISRLQSSYSFFKNIKDTGGNRSKGAPLDNWHDYVDFALENDNEHWRPQVEHSGGIQTKVHRFEDLSKVFFRYHPRHIGHKNRSARVPVDNYRIKDIVDYYSEDMNLWLGAEI